MAWTVGPGSAEPVTFPGPRARTNDREPTRGSHRGQRPVVVETEWMAAAETRMSAETKALAEREASMDGKVEQDHTRRERQLRVGVEGDAAGEPVSRVLEVEHEHAHGNTAKRCLRCAIHHSPRLGLRRPKALKHAR